MYKALEAEGKDVNGKDGACYFVDETVFKIDGPEDLKQQDGRDDREDGAVSVEHAVVPGR